MFWNRSGVDKLIVIEDRAAVFTKALMRLACISYFISVSIKFLNLLAVRISLLLFAFVFKIFTDPGLDKIWHSLLVCRCGFAFISSFYINRMKLRLH